MSIDTVTTSTTTNRWLWPTITVVLAFLSVGTLVAAFVLNLGAEPADANPPLPSQSATVTPATPTPSATTPTPTQNVPIAELADPAWVKRIAAAGDIPERAMSAYAGAAIELSRIKPNCGIGWNTLAAIGFVETEHGSLNGATLNPDGTVTPPIIGIPLNGNGADPVPDTDDGQLDGDPTWDHAVGPMQFIPSTWEKTAQDGNRDGKKDINQIDDAVLAAAIHLCEVGGNLTYSENWIAAISAYNPSATYNNRVSDAATYYATLT
ncbi:MAG: lytic transglycosylase domain-containing protein [Propionibacteriaceae bacterium]|jgi:membrane-bound lytic murein transglycosylase B|nr:lytic transglycosylase domain-containing protein [Propionibacteriaceae bacterium]